MKKINYVWRISLGFFTTGIIVAILNNASGSFETASLAIMVIIYLTISSFASTWGMATIEANQALGNNLNLIIKSLKRLDSNKEGIADFLDDGYTKEEREEIEEEVINEKKDLNIKYYINVVFQAIAYLIALGFILSTL